MEKDLGNVSKADIQGWGLGGTSKLRGLVDKKEAAKQPGKEGLRGWKSIR